MASLGLSKVASERLAERGYLRFYPELSFVFQESWKGLASGDDSFYLGEEKSKFCSPGTQWLSSLGDLGWDPRCSSIEAVEVLPYSSYYYWSQRMGETCVYFDHVRIISYG